MSTIDNWSTTAASNNASSPNGFPEGMAPSGVNDSAREVMAAVAKWYQDQQGSLTTGGSASAYTLTTNGDYAALSDLPLLVFEVHAANSASATLNVDGLGAKGLKKSNDVSLAASDLAENQRCLAVYNADDDVFELFTQTATVRASDIETTRISANDGTTAINIANSTGAVDIDTSLNVDGTVTDNGATHDGDVIFTGASYNVAWDKSDNALEFADNAKATFGAGGDLSIYHDGSNSYINDTATGNLKLAASQVDILGGTDGAETMATFVDNGAVTLYHDNSSKLATSASGVTVTGAVNPSTGITLADDVNLTFGTGSDATIDFSGSHLEIRQANDAQDTYFYDASGNARLRLDTDQGDLYLYNYDSGTDGPNLIFNHPSSSPADSDTIGRLYFVADNSADENTYYSTVVVLSEDVTDGSEDGGIYLQALTAGTNKNYIVVNSSGEKAVRLYYDGSQKLITDSAGINVTGDLDASGSIFARGAVGSYSETGLYLSNEGSSVMQIGAWRSGASVAELAFAIDSGSDSAPVEKMRLDSSGQLGIGTTSPGAQLHVSNATQAVMRLQDSGGTNQYGQMYHNSGSTYFSSRNASSHGQFYWATYNGTDVVNRMALSASGVLTKANQPAFQVLPSSDQSNVPIDTWTTVVFDSERFDVAGNFASNTFTAPVTGKYMLSVNVRFQSIDADASYYYLAIVTSNEWYMNLFSTPDDLSYLHKGFNVVADMDASDTAYVQVYQSGGAAQTDIDAESWFSGYLLG